MNFKNSSHHFKKYQFPKILKSKDLELIYKSLNLKKKKKEKKKFSYITILLMKALQVAINKLGICVCTYFQGMRC